MLMSLTAAFAENDNEIENNENIIDTSSLTDENVLYKATSYRRRMVFPCSGWTIVMMKGLQQILML